MAIQRYDNYYEGGDPSDDGPWVHYSAHAAEVARLVKALRGSQEGLDLAINRFRKMGIMEEADRYFPYVHDVEAVLADYPEVQ